MILSLRNMLILILIAVVVGATTTWGLKAMIHSETPTSKEVEAIESPFKLVMLLNKTEFAIGELVTLNLKLVNIGNSTVSVLFLTRNPSSWLRFKVYNASDDLIFESSIAAWPATTEMLLDPGGSIGQTHEWKQTDNAGHKIEAGIYRIIGFVDAVWEPKISLETLPIEISIS